MTATRLLITVLSTALAWTATAQTPASADAERYALAENFKATDDLEWHNLLGGVADVEKVVFTGLPDIHARPTDLGPQPMVLFAYTFIPKSLDRQKKHPLIVFLHGGVHGSTLTGGPDNDGRLIAELVAQGYAVISPDYRGSSGYGAAYEHAMDYGGREDDDAIAAREWMLTRYSFLDPARVGVVGWSHGGMIALMNLFQHPELYACGFAGVPVSDLAVRMTYVTNAYRAEMAASIGVDVDNDREAYMKRSPVAYAAELRRPLLIDADTSDETVHIVEIQHLIAALDAARVPYSKHIYQAAPGGHFFNRIDTPLAVQSRAEIYQFLKEYLKP